jgi:hypothetical protein
MNECDVDTGLRLENETLPADTLYRERHRVEAQLNQPDTVSTEILRLALRRYRSLSRLLSPY